MTQTIATTREESGSSSSRDSVRVLLVEDNPTDTFMVKAMLAEYFGPNVDCECASTLADALAELRISTPSCVLLDLRLPDSDGLASLKEIVRSALDVPVVVLTGLADESVALEAVRNGAQDYLVKGKIDADLMGRVIRYAIGRESAHKALATRERWFNTVLQSSSDLIAVVDNKGRLLYGNSAHEQIFGFSQTEQVGLNMLDLIHPGDRERADVAFKRNLSRPGVHPAGTYRFRTRPGDWRFIEVVSTNRLNDPAIAGVVVNARDVTERTNLLRALRTLGTGNEILVRATNEASLLQDICENIVTSEGYKLAWVGYADNDEARTVRPVASAGCTESLEGVSISWGNDELGDSPTGTAIRTDTAQVLKDMRRSKKFKPWLASAEKFGFRTLCALPLTVSGSSVGVLTICDDQPGVFEPDSVAILAQLADDLSYGIGRIRDAHALEVSEERFRTLAGAAPIGIFEVSADAAANYANPRLAEITGRDAAALMGRGWIDAAHPDDSSELFSLTEALSSERAKVTAGFRILRPDGAVRHVHLIAVPKVEDVGSGYVVTVRDVTEEVQAQEQLVHQASYDSLTGLANRTLFLDRLSQELAQQRRRSSNVAVLFMDLDRFKNVNDSLGHEAGDAVLKEVGDRLMRAVRAGETVARFGGDEYMLIIRDIHEVQDAISAANRVLDALRSPIRCVGQNMTVTGSIGIVIADLEAEAATVLRDADTAMYKAKEAGRNRYELFDDDLHRRSVTRLAIEGELRSALEHHEFEVYYQPKIDLSSGQPMGAEALIRWHHPTRGMVPPMEFIPVAEDSGLIQPIGDWVFEQAVAQLALWDKQRDGPRLDVMAVNVSARQLDEPATAGTVSEVLERHAIAPSRVALEITETAIMGGSATARQTLESFKKLAVRVSIDDFGTGYSSLAYLHTLPVTTVKVDHSFVERMGGPDDSTPVVQAIIDLSHAMGLRVVAEGVSEERLLDLVVAMGCEVAQGFYWSPPLPADEFAEWWQDAVRQPRPPDT